MRLTLGYYYEYDGETCYKPKRYVDVKMKSIVATYLSVFEEHTHTYRAQSDAENVTKLTNILRTCTP